VGDSLTLLDMFLRGLGSGAILILGGVALRPGVSRDQRIAIVLASLSISAWLISESPTAWAAFGRPAILAALAWPVGAFFWLLVLAVFEDVRVTPLTLAPAAAQMLLGAVHVGLPAPFGVAGWWLLNAVSGVLALHACLVVARGWSGDLVEGRRRLRGLLLGVSAVFAASMVVVAFAGRLDPSGPWYAMGGGRPYGGGFISLVTFATVVMFLQMRPAVFGAARRPAAGPDPRVEAAERLMMEKLNAFMGGGGWRREGLTIGQVAAELAEPEHRLRRLINRRLGHRNFADFVNGHRIEAAKARLADPIEARTTVAAIAFDLGYGSLGPFNRAFRAATGSTPTEWRRAALAASPELQEAV
jgi:AraC-like DNA-binding protein